ncbi:toll/interleukin-1 receptor domain-containing protein [Deinococcus multiflagellatus]|uniref:Toll/interleukin-1 receptor domain-containing protein n=1 Tax=Deinococcus multiflagellatus TaxID=1656887 RepID=A0ABW1ZP83_9DEIO
MTTPAAETPVKTFISYAWTSESHKARVRALADRLRLKGIDVILDQYHLRDGEDANAFMELVATQGPVKKVVVICDPKYVQRMNARQGAVARKAPS